MKKGKLIVFEGPDGSGKSTISQMLYQYLRDQNLSAYRTAEPTDSPIGSIIRNVFNRRIETDERTIAALFLADRIDHLTNKQNGIVKQIAEGKHVVADRYYYSSYAYHVPYVSLDWVINANSICADILRPDIVFYMDITVEESLKRLHANRQTLDLFETKDRISQVIKNYKSAIEKEGKKDNVVIIDASRSIDEIFEEIKEYTDKLVVK